MPSEEISKNIVQISACCADINAFFMKPSDLSAVTSCHAGAGVTVLRSAVSVAIASFTAGRACMRSR
ncbi:hypothetical protein ABIB73_003539 [Bradyrhizobium sp. F1.4.3]